MRTCLCDSSPFPPTMKSPRTARPLRNFIAGQLGCKAKGIIVVGSDADGSIETKSCALFTAIYPISQTLKPANLHCYVHESKILSSVKDRSHLVIQGYARNGMISSIYGYSMHVLIYYDLGKRRRLSKTHARHDKIILNVPTTTIIQPI